MVDSTDIKLQNLFVALLSPVSEAATEVFYKERCSEKFRKIYRKKPVPESLF